MPVCSISHVHESFFIMTFNTGGINLIGINLMQYLIIFHHFPGKICDDIDNTLTTEATPLEQMKGVLKLMARSVCYITDVSQDMKVRAPRKENIDILQIFVQDVFG